jgi:hypothetical protein
MDNFDFNGTEVLDLSEMIAIDGGSKLTYEIGRAVGHWLVELFK